MTDKQISKTPHGDECIVPDKIISEIILKQGRGCYQDVVAVRLCMQGYVIGYMANGEALKGKARDYKTHYARSLANLMCRITDALPEGYYLLSGEVGPNGGFGYYLSR